MVKATFRPAQLTPHLQEYRDLFNHLPAPEDFKSKTTQELEKMAEIAVFRGKPVKNWESRPSQVTGSIIDDLYN